MAPDRRARIATLYTLLQPRLERHVRARATRDPEIIQDACAFAWLQLLAQPKVLLDPPPFNWLAIVARRKAWELARRAASVDQLADHGDQVSPPLEDTICARERLALVDAIPERPRRFLMRLALGYSYDEIGTIEGASYTTVNKQMARAKHRLRELDAA